MEDNSNGLHAYCIVGLFRLLNFSQFENWVSVFVFSSPNLDYDLLFWIVYSFEVYEHCDNCDRALHGFWELLKRWTKNSTRSIHPALISCTSISQEQEWLLQLSFHNFMIGLWIWWLALQSHYYQCTFVNLSCAYLGISAF